jgi:hypothetical protein
MNKLGILLVIALITYGAATLAVDIFGEGAAAAYVGGAAIVVALLVISRTGGSDE